jgi:pimeloyl-ACP methyl ester carboxylesterase
VKTEITEHIAMSERNSTHGNPYRPPDRASKAPLTTSQSYPVTNLQFDRLPEQSANRNGPVILMLPGWKNSRAAMRPLGSLLSSYYDTILLGLPGFSKDESPIHDGSWGPPEYADCAFQFLKGNHISEIIIIGHSFGAHVGIHLAFKHPEIVKSLVLIAAPGLQPTGFKRLKRNLKHKFNRLVKTAPIPQLLTASCTFLPKRFTKHCTETYRNHCVSKDYQEAGPLRTTLNKAVTADLTLLACAIKAPTLLLYGVDDTETPPEFGQRYHRLFQQSSFIAMDGKNHFPHLASGAPLCAYYIVRFLSAYETSISNRHE